MVEDLRAFFINFLCLSMCVHFRTISSVFRLTMALSNRWVLSCFVSSFLRPKGNLVKSQMVLVGFVFNTRSLASILGCKVSSLPIKYLGLPLGAAYKAKAIGDGVIEKIERRLARKGFTCQRGKNHMVWKELLEFWRPGMLFGWT